MHASNRRAFTVNVVQFRLCESKFLRIVKYCKRRRRFQTDTPDTNENSKTSTPQVEIGQYLPQTLYRGTSLTRKRTPLGPCRGPMPRVLGGSKGGCRFLMGEVPLHSMCVVSSVGRKGITARWSSTVSLPHFWGGYVTTFAPHQTLDLIA